MRKVLAVLLVVAMLFGFACAEVSAYELAIALAEVFDQISDVRQVDLDGLKNRAVWSDSRANARCALVVFEDAALAQQAQLSDSTRDTAVRAVDACALYLDSDMGADAILDYQLVLAEMLGADLQEEAPDYILNVNTGKFHHPDCSSVEDMKETNKQAFTGDRKAVIDQGYVPCKRCKP